MAWSNPSTRSSGYKVTAANWNEVINDLLFLPEIGYVEYSTNVASTATTAATAVQVVALGAITYTADPILVEFYSPRLTPGGGQGVVELCDGATALGSLGTFAAAAVAAPVFCQREFTPTAAAHTYNIRIWTLAAGTITAGAGAGGAGVLAPGFIRARYVPR
jgi:hypothetical protein